MQRTKISNFSDGDVALAEFFRALSHPARISILRALAERGECVCGEIVEVLPLAQSTVSQHLKQLREAGLITGEVDGAKSCYCIDVKNLQKLFQLLSKFESKVSKESNKSKSCC